MLRRRSSLFGLLMSFTLRMQASLIGKMKLSSFLNASPHLSTRSRLTNSLVDLSASSFVMISCIRFRMRFTSHRRKKFKKNLSRSFWCLFLTYNIKFKNVSLLWQLGEHDYEILHSKSSLQVFVQFLLHHDIFKYCFIYENNFIRSADQRCDLKKFRLRKVENLLSRHNKIWFKNSRDNSKNYSWVNFSFIGNFFILQEGKSFL